MALTGISIVPWQPYADRAADRAEATDPGFKINALAAFIAFAKIRGGRPFFTTEARASSGIRGSGEARSWGNIPRQAQKLGYVRRLDYASSPDESTHGGPRSRWIWTGKE